MSLRFDRREVTEARRLGWLLRDGRIAAKMSLREAAKRLGLKDVELSNIERGIDDPTDSQLNAIIALFPTLQEKK